MPQFAPEIKRVAVFKNGYAFTYREGQAATNNGWAYTTRTPIGVMGTVWGYTTASNVRVMQLLASESERGEMERVTNLAEFLLANEGARVRIDPDFTDKIFEGTYEILSQHRNFAVNPRIAESGNETTFEPGKITVALKTETGVMVFPAGDIQSIEVIGQAKWMKPSREKENRLAMKVEGAKDGENVNLGVAALERGVRWIPAYRVEVKGEPIKEARLELEAMLINELADLKDSEVYFVVGVPNFLFQDTMSPLSLNKTFAGVSSYFQTAARNNYSNAIMTQQARSGELRSRDGDDDEAFSAPSSPEEQAASLTADQLFLYKANNISLKKGERASLRLFSHDVPCAEVFEWMIDDSSAGSGATSGDGRFQNLSNRIWYSLRLKNTTGMPWTTAPILSFRDWKPMGQDIMSFTPVADENIIRVTPATEVTGLHKLEEKSRVRQQLRESGTLYDYDLITLEGTIKLRNAKKQPIELVLTRSVSGEVLSATDTGKISRDGLNLQAVNPNSIVKWNLNVPPGEKEIRYTYKIYVRK